MRDPAGLVPAGAAPARLGWRLAVAGVAAVVVASALAAAVGPAGLPPWKVFLELLDRLPLVDVDSGLSAAQAAIVWEVRLPRIVLGLLVGAMLAGAGAGYQAVFRNPLADPYLLGVAAGAGLGATLAIVARLDVDGWASPVPLAAFVGAVVAVAATGLLGATRRAEAGTTRLILAGIAVAAFFTACQTYVQQRHAETLREVYSWILGRLATSGWTDVAVLVPYAAVMAGVLWWYRGALDVLAVGDEEAASLGVDPGRVRWAVLGAASLGAAAAVAVAGLIGFVGLVVPHLVRLLTGVSNRRVVPLALAGGAAFLVVADIAARSIDAPAELPIGVVTAFIGAPFFLLVLRREGATA